VPKSLFTKVGFYDPKLDGWKGTKIEGIHSTVLNRKGDLSEIVLESLGLTAGMIEETQSASRDFARKFFEMEKQFTTLTNQLPDGKSSGDFPALVTPAFAEECKPLRQELEESFIRIMGREKSDVLWEFYAASFYQNCLIDRIMVLDLSAGDWMPSIANHAQDGFPSAWFVNLEELPTEFLPYVNERLSKRGKESQP
jgi:hypothetical protein